MTTEELLINQFGLFLNIQQTAKVLHRSSEGLRVTLAGNSDLAQRLRTAKIKIGRRVLFKASVLGQILDAA